MYVFLIRKCGNDTYIFRCVQFRKNKSLLCDEKVKKKSHQLLQFGNSLKVVETHRAHKIKTLTYLLFVRIVNRFKSDRLHNNYEHSNEAPSSNILDKHLQNAVEKHHGIV